jgi:hypothetical protein
MKQDRLNRIPTTTSDVPASRVRGISLASLALCLLVLSLIATTPSHATQVDQCEASPGSQCTLTFNLQNGDAVSGSVSVSGGSGNDVNFWITDPTGATIYNAGRISGGTTFSFTADTAGAYILYFDNSFSIISSKYVTVSYDVSVTLIPGVSPTTSYAIIALIVIVVLALIIVVLVVMRGRKRGTSQPPVSQAPMPQRP